MCRVAGESKSNFHTGIGDLAPCAAYRCDPKLVEAVCKVARNAEINVGARRASQSDGLRSRWSLGLFAQFVDQFDGVDDTRLAPEAILNTYANRL